VLEEYTPSGQQYESWRLSPPTSRVGALEQLAHEPFHVARNLFGGTMMGFVLPITNFASAAGAASTCWDDGECTVEEYNQLWSWGTQQDDMTLAQNERFKEAFGGPLRQLNRLGTIIEGVPTAAENGWGEAIGRSIANEVETDPPLVASPALRPEGPCSNPGSRCTGTPEQGLNIVVVGDEQSEEGPRSTSTPSPMASGVTREQIEADLQQVPDGAPPELPDRIFGGEPVVVVDEVDLEGATVGFREQNGRPWLTLRDGGLAVPYMRNGELHYHYYGPSRSAGGGDARFRQGV
jgi:hypothetical protein